MRDASWLRQERVCRGQMAVAQAILDGTIRSGVDVSTSIKKYRIVSRTNVPVSDSVKRAVSAVFDDGQRVTSEKWICMHQSVCTHLGMNLKTM